jgi:hypothetical protein
MLLQLTCMFAGLLVTEPLQIFKRDFETETVVIWLGRKMLTNTGVTLFSLLLPISLSLSLLGAGEGRGSCPASPYRGAKINWPNGCPLYVPCCTEFGFCKTEVRFCNIYLVTFSQPFYITSLYERHAKQCFVKMSLLLNHKV